MNEYISIGPIVRTGYSVVETHWNYPHHLGNDSRALLITWC